MFSNIYSLIPYIVSGIIFYTIFVAVREYTLKKTKRYINHIERIIMVVAAIFFMIIFAVSISPANGINISAGMKNFSLLPFGTFFREGGFLRLFGSIAAFIPIGFFPPVLSRGFRNIKNAGILCAIVSVGKEIIQFFFGQGTYIDDILFNLLGALLGYFAAMFLLLGVPYLRNETGIMSLLSNKKIKKDRYTAWLLIVFMTLSVVPAGLYENTVHEDKIKINSSSKQQEDTEKTDYFDFKNINIDGRLAALTLGASNICVVDLNNSSQILAFNQYAQIKPASTTKLLTAMTALRHLDPDEQITAGDELNFVYADSTKAGIKAGQTFTVRQLLEGLLLPSGNDSAYVLAAYAGKKLLDQDTQKAANDNLNKNQKNLNTQNMDYVDKSPQLTLGDAILRFVREMNAVAIELGASHSNFLSPDGYDTENQYTTAYDMACIAAGFLADDSADGLLPSIVKQPEISETINDGTVFTWKNSNFLLHPDGKYYYPNCIGLKTGSSSGAGKCLVSASQINGRTYISVLMNDKDPARFSDSLQIYLTIESNYIIRKLRDFTASSAVITAGAGTGHKER
ncbi:MAG: hypothetical protein HFE90_02890 [Firmicutes bacterium]|nr:hypothetical protein [Bacillota bacterium]